MPAVQPLVLLLWGPLVLLGLFSGFCGGGGCPVLSGTKAGSESFGWQIKFYPGGNNNLEDSILGF